MGFRRFQNKEEEAKAAELIATIDKGEKWIFEGAEGSEDFGGFIDRLYYSDKGTYGTFCSSVFCGKLRIQIGFNTDMPDELSSELIALVENARYKLNSFTSVWYMPTNKKLEYILYNNLPWKANGHRTHELTAMSGDFGNMDCVLPQDLTIIPFEEKYITDTCRMLDLSMARTFEDPNSGVFLKNKDDLINDWAEKGKTGQCCIMLENNKVIGAYILKGAEIDILAVAVHKQSKGFGKQLLIHAVKNIMSSSEELPYLYCIDRNSDALSFYLKQGMKITGYSGYVFFH